MTISRSVVGLQELILLIVVLVQICSGNRYNVTLLELTACKEYRIEGGFVYRNFFLLENIENNRNENETLRLKFYVMAQNNAHILLSSVDNARKQDRVYEIVIGAGKNTFSTIRPNIGGSQLIVKKQNGILNGIDPTPIIVVQKRDGTIEVTIPSFSGPLLLYRDPKPLLIKYVSFSSYGTTSARWFYDCKQDKAARLEMETRNLTTLEQLQQELFKNYSIFTTPHKLEQIFMGGTVKGVSYDVKKSVFQVRMELKMTWFDVKLQWDPFKYDNITALRSFEVNFWTPPLLIANGAKGSFVEFDPEYFGVLHHNGTVEAYTKQQTIETWCKEPAEHNWPLDRLKCSVDFGIDGVPVSIVFDQNARLRAAKMTESTEWRLQSLGFQTKQMISYSDKMQGLNTTYGGVSLQVQMRRSTLFYMKVFVTPSIVASILILLSFQVQRLVRSILNLFALLLLLGAFVYLTSFIPVTYVPKIVHLYETLLGIVCFSYILSILNVWLVDYPLKTTPPACVMAIVNNSVLRCILRLQFADSTDYLKIQHEPWKQVGLILDRTIFVILFIAFVFGLCFFI